MKGQRVIKNFTNDFQVLNKSKESITRRVEWIVSIRFWCALFPRAFYTTKKSKKHAEHKQETPETPMDIVIDWETVCIVVVP